MAKFFINEGIWHIELDGLSKLKSRTIRFVQLVIVTLKNCSHTKVGVQSMSLSYLCTLAIVPLLAVMMVITDGFGLENYLNTYLTDSFGNNETVVFILDRTSVFLDYAQSSWAGLISSMTLVWIVIRMMFNVEGCFDLVWKVDKGRSFIKKIAYDLVILILSPFVVMIFFYAPIVNTRIFALIGFTAEQFPFLTSFTGFLLIYTIVAFTMTAMYKYIPNTEVKYHNAWRAAFPAALVFCIFQFVYIESQSAVSKWNAVYGAMAAVPLFMLWLNMSWQIILYGAEVSYALQTVDTYREPDNDKLD